MRLASLNIQKMMLLFSYSQKTCYTLDSYGCAIDGVHSRNAIGSKISPKIATLDVTSAWWDVPQCFENVDLHQQSPNFFSILLHLRVRIKEANIALPSFLIRTYISLAYL